MAALPFSFYIPWEYFMQFRNWRIWQPLVLWHIEGYSIYDWIDLTGQFRLLIGNFSLHIICSSYFERVAEVIESFLQCSIKIFILFRGYRAISWFYWINSKDFINYVLKSTIKATSVPKNLKTILTVTAMRLKWNITEFTFNAGGEILQRQKRLKHQTTGEILRGIERNFPATVFLASS